MTITGREKLRFTQPKDQFIRPVCNTCIYNNRNATCQAFPRGIPFVILDGQSKHKRPFKGQKNDLVYTEEI